MSQKYEKLKGLLQELFQLDQPELDFGLYRIMHAKAAEVTQFLDRDLLPQVKRAFALYKTADKAEIQKELGRVVAGIEAAGLNPDDSPKVRELRARLAEDAVDIGALESEVYDHLFRFFRRYYSDGDFLSKRVYKPGVYAIPYAGEEVTLHWANKDQYYIKTSEYLRDYAFRLRPDSATNPMRVHFRLVDATEGEHGNVKEAQGKERVFILAHNGASGHDFIAEEDGPTGKELVLRFEFRAATMHDWPPEQREEERERLKNPKPPKQKDLNALAVSRLLGVSQVALAPWIAELAKPHVLSTGETADYTRLEAHLRGYSDRNTFDYFIHKDLGGFLATELDFYIKNEVMHLDDIESESVPRAEQYLSKIKVIRAVAGKIIDFLAQLEDFQKTLWLKKKFVVETSWCIRVGCIPEAFHGEIAANEAQTQEWVTLHAIDELQGEQRDLTKPSYTEPLTPDFVAANPTLMVDSRHFSDDFTARLFNTIDHVDEQTDGVLFHSENFQALRIVREKYVGAVDCVYADPPYNTSEETFVYKNLYKHSSWLAMMGDRGRVVRTLMAAGGILFCAIDDQEVAHLRMVLDEVLGGENWLGTLVVESNPRGRGINSFYATSHDYYLVYARSVGEAEILDLPLTEEQAAAYRHGAGEQSFRLLPFRRSGGLSTPAERPKSEFPLYFSADTGIVSTFQSPGAVSIMPVDSNGRRRVWRWSDREKINEAGARGDFVVRKKEDGYSVLLKDYYKPGRKPKTVWSDAKYDASSHGTNLVQAVVGDRGAFSYPKSIFSVEDALRSSLGDQGITLDYFAGSGTTGHAVINLNREDGGQRKFILVEMGDYFDTVLLPRLKKITFTPEWKLGRPKRMATPEEAERSPRIMKVVRLESYEDTLNNLETRRTEAQQDLLEQPAAQGADGLKEQYVLRYMLEVETRGSQSLLNVEAFADPTAYELKVKRPGSDESRQVNVDLIETFNWLIGLTVRHMAAPQAFSAESDRDEEGRLRLKGRLREQADGPYWFRTVTGTLPDGRRALIIWRKLTGDPEHDNLILDEWFTKQGYSSKDSEFDLIYVNGGNNLENLRTPEDAWKVRLIEEDFHRLMFEGERG